MIGRGQGGAGEESCGGDPDGDLREADGADAEQLAGEQILRASDGEHDLKDARAFFFDDGARHVHAVEKDGHGHEEGHQHGRVERRHALALAGLAVWRRPGGFQGERLGRERELGRWIMPCWAETQIEEGRR